MINKLLERQIAKYISPHMAENQALQDFIKAINNSYNSFERDLELLRHAFEMNEQEYEAVNKSLIYQSELKQKSINNLLSTIKKMDPNYQFSTKDNVDDLLAISEFLSTQISERKAAEEKYKSIVENATDIIYKVNQKGYFTFVNQVAERITGFTTAQLLNTRFTDLVVPDYQQKVTDFYAKQIADKVPTSYFEFPINTKNGNQIWIGQSVQFPQIESESVEITALAIDITQQKLAQDNLKVQEEKYRNIIANMNLGLIEVDLNDIILYANQSFCNLSGYSIHELLNKPAAKLLMDEQAQAIVSSKKTQRAQGVSDIYTVKILNKQKQERWWAISAAPRYNDKNEIVGSVGIHLDITAQKQLEIDLNMAKGKAEESSKAKESFLATMSHEIRTPLNAIIGITDLLRNSKDIDYNEALDILSFSSQNLLALISDILDITKIDSGKIELSKNIISVKQLLHNICNGFKQKCDEKQIKLLLKLQPNVPQQVLGDELRLSQILNNILSNAVKFTHAGAIKVNVKAINATKHNQKLEFKIEDTGIGIQADKLKKVFEDFEQADSNVAHQYGGTGLGLAITKRLVELQQGAINLKSAFGKGTTFTITIPFGPVLETSISHNFSNTYGPVSNLNINSKILLVEDNLANQKVIGAYLKMWNLNHHIADNGTQAMEFLNKNKYDLVLTDLFMPVMDGFTLIENLRASKTYKRMPIVALTASTEQHLIDKALHSGANKVLAKPINAIQLKGVLYNLLSVELDNAMLPKRPSQDQLNELPKQFSFKRIEDASLGKPEFVKEIVNVLKTQIPLLINSCDTAINKGDYQAFANNLHKLKNDLLMFEMDHLRLKMQFMEDHARAGKNKKKIKECFAGLVEDWNAVKAAVYNY